MDGLISLLDKIEEQKVNPVRKSSAF